MFWSEPMMVGGRTDLLVCPDGKREALQVMTSSGLGYTVKSTDVQKYFTLNSLNLISS